MYKLHLSFPTGFKLNCPDLTVWLTMWGMKLFTPRTQVRGLDLHNVSQSRIGLCRNESVADAKTRGATHIWFIDPDMCPDWMVQRYGATPFWPGCWDFIRTMGACVVAAPYAGMADTASYKVHVFRREVGNRLVRLAPEEAAELTGWHRVGGVGTGCMLIDMRVFDILDRDQANGQPVPYFKDLYTDGTMSQLKTTQDIYFCHRLLRHKIPLYVNFDCWMGHYQNCIVGGPREDFRTKPPEDIAEWLAQDEIAAESQSLNGTSESSESDEHLKPLRIAS
jgi:hypothetical protein